jgi:hypothetical protein
VATRSAQKMLPEEETRLRLGSWPACSRRIAHAELGCLKLHPVWDPLRGDPRFEQIVASLALKKP